MPDDATEDELLTSSQAGVILGKSSPTVRRLVAAGKLPTAGKLPGPNGAFLLRRSDVVAYRGPQPEPADAA